MTTLHLERRIEKIYTKRRGNQILQPIILRAR